MQGTINILLALVLAFAFPANAAAQEITEQEQSDKVSDIFPLSLEEMRERLLVQFDADARTYFDDYNRGIYDLPEKVLTYKELSPKAYDKFMALPLIKPTKFYVFYAAYPTKQHLLKRITPLSVIGSGNPALERYAALSEEARAYDLYLWSPDVPYWHSEYSLVGVPLPFKTYFILHLSARDETHTEVEVIEEHPVVRLEESPSLDANGQFKEFEIRPVSPTTKDRKLLLHCIRQFVDNRYESRSKFNCKPPPERLTAK